MSVLILYINENQLKEISNAKKNPSPQEVINEVIERHQTLQDAIVIKRTDEDLPGGFEIIKEDDTLSNVLKRDDTYKLANVKDRGRHVGYEKDGAKHSGDQVFKGAKPYRNQ